MDGYILRESWPCYTLGVKLSQAFFSRILPACPDLHREVHMEEIQAHQHGCMLTGRQITHMVFRHVRLSESDATLAELTEFFEVKVKRGDDKKCLYDWGMCLNRMMYPVEHGYLENMFKQQLNTVPAFTRLLGLYVLDIDQGRASKDDQRLRYIINRNHDSIPIEKNVQSVTSSHAYQHYANTTNYRHRINSGDAGANAARQQYGRSWTKKGKFHRGDRCPFKHDEAKKGATYRSSSRGKGNGQGGGKENNGKQGGRRINSSRESGRGGNSSSGSSGRRRPRSARARRGSPSGNIKPICGFTPCKIKHTDDGPMSGINQRFLRVTFALLFLKCMRGWRRRSNKRNRINNGINDLGLCVSRHKEGYSVFTF